MNIEEANKRLGTSCETWGEISRHELTEEFMEEAWKKLDKEEVSIHQKMSEGFMEKHWAELDKEWVSIHQKMSEGFMEKHWADLDKGWVSANQKMSEGFMEKHWADLDKGRVSANQKMSEGFMEKHWADLDKVRVSKYQKMSEGFMEKHWSELDKGRVSEYQKMSEGFMEKRWADLDKGAVSEYQKMSEEFRTRHNIPLPEDNWLYFSDEQKLAEIKKCGLYELDGDTIIAYKGIRSDNYSKYNFQYKYEIGGEYESHCDCTSSEGSFGLSAWTLEKAREYCDEKIVKVSIKISDLGRIVHDGGKLRCFKFRVLEGIK